MDNLEKARGVKAALVDSIGVLISAYEYLDPATKGIRVKRSHIDGQGLSYLRGAGVLVALFDDAAGSIRILVEKFNSLPSCKSGAWPEVEILSDSDKEKAAETWLASKGLTWQECAAIGDDVGDLSFLRKAAFSAAPAQAEKKVRETVDLVCARRDGDGAVRDFVNAILEAKGVDIEKLPKK